MWQNTNFIGLISVRINAGLPLLMGRGGLPLLLLIEVIRLDSIPTVDSTLLLSFLLVRVRQLPECLDLLRLGIPSIWLGL